MFVRSSGIQIPLKQDGEWILLDVITVTFDVCECGLKNKTILNTEILADNFGRCDWSNFSQGLMGNVKEKMVNIIIFMFSSGPQQLPTLVSACKMLIECVIVRSGFYMNLSGKK